MFERTFDYDLARAIVTHPKLYRPSQLSDFAPERGAYRVVEDPAIWYVLARGAAGDPLGLFMFVPRSPVWWEVHLCFLPGGWGRSRDISLACAHWFSEQTGCRKLSATVPAYNRLMHSLAARLGMERVGVLTASVRQAGRLCDQTIFSLSI